MHDNLNAENKALKAAIKVLKEDIKSRDMVIKSIKGGRVTAPEKIMVLYISNLPVNQKKMLKSALEHAYGEISSVCG